MGLDMYLHGGKYLWKTECPEEEDGFRLSTKTFELGYWRKHPNLHGFIVETYANGQDHCQRIELGLENLKEILKAVEEDKLPHTEGFFFGESSEEDKEPTIKILKDAIEWLQIEESDVSRMVYYQASW